jgi:serine/threonine-protein kinase ATR
LLVEDPEGISRGLRLRTYSVICLDEECGLLEWVENTRPIRLCTIDGYNLVDIPAIQPTGEFIGRFNKLQKTYACDIEGLVEGYREMVLSKCPPCLRHWFLTTFSDATKWLEARDMFTRSAAVWSVVGFILGLGDRHHENILIDFVHGECVFVDFDCVFDRGLYLSGTFKCLPMKNHFLKQIMQIL